MAENWYVMGKHPITQVKGKKKGKMDFSLDPSSMLQTEICLSILFHLCQ